MNDDSVGLCLIVSDLHAGSTVAAMPPEFETIDGCRVVANPVQSWFYDRWREMVDWALEYAKHDRFALVLNGDMIEGLHHRSPQVIAGETVTHTNLAHHLLNDLNEMSAATFMVRGTECHTGESEIALGGRLGAERCPETGKCASDMWRVRMNGVLCSFAHHCSATSRRWLESGEFSRFIAHEQGEAARAGYEIPRVFGRAHRHRHGVFKEGGSMGVITSAWQGLTRFGHKVVPGSVPAPSAVMLDWRDCKPGELPMDKEFWRTLPERKAVTL